MSIRPQATPSVLSVLFCLAFALPMASQAAPQAASSAVANAAEPDSQQMEHDLQRLSWDRFRFVIESVPEMKSGVERYGALGWEFLKSRYQTYGWKRNIDRLEPGERLRLARLIENAKGTTPRSAPAR